MLASAKTVLPAMPASAENCLVALWSCSHLLKIGGRNGLHFVGMKP